MAMQGKEKRVFWLVFADHLPTEHPKQVFAKVPPFPSANAFLPISPGKLRWSG